MIPVIFVQKLRQILLMSVCSVRKWTVRVLSAESFAAKTDPRIDFRSGKAGKLGDCPRWSLYKETTPPFLPPWKVLSIGGTPFQTDFFPESVVFCKVDSIYVKFASITR